MAPKMKLASQSTGNRQSQFDVLLEALAYIISQRQMRDRWAIRVPAVQAVAR